jgi:hypothetical protein
MSAAVAVATEAVRERRRPGRREILEEEFDPLMPAQWYADAGRGAAMQPEKRLMFAVLSDAVDIVMTPRGTTNIRRRMLFHETAAWIRSDDREWPYSFVNLCDALGFDPGRLRAGLARFGDELPQLPDVDVQAPADPDEMDGVITDDSPSCAPRCEP